MTLAVTHLPFTWPVLRTNLCSRLPGRNRGRYKPTNHIIMRPQPDEPCVNCKLWDGRTKEGCKKGHYNSASMIIFGHCGFCWPKRTKKEAGA